MGTITKANVEDVMTPRPQLRPDQALKLAEIQTAGRHFIETILAAAPTCADQQAAIRKAREAMHTAKDAILLDGNI